MKYQIHNAVVIGAGTMGAAIAAHLANTGVPVTLLDIVPKDAPADNKEARNKIVNDGLERAKKSRPASFFSSDQYSLVKTGNLEDDFARLSQYLFLGGWLLGLGYATGFGFLTFTSPWCSSFLSLSYWKGILGGSLSGG